VGTLSTDLKEGIDHGGNVVFLTGIRLPVPQTGEEITHSIHVTSALQSNKDKRTDVKINKKPVPVHSQKKAQNFLFIETVE
jgi:hypothetical protein